MKIFLLIILTHITCLWASAEKGKVVCIHGFLGSTYNMLALEKQLLKDGWDVMNWGYKSRDYLIAEHGQRLSFLLEELAYKTPGRPIHFVAHSMGSLVLLSALNDPRCPLEAKIGKVVAMAPPFHGSYWGRFLGQFPWARKIAKDFAGQELLTKESFDDLGEFPDSLNGLLIVVGNLSLNPFLDKESDGTVLIEESIPNFPHRLAVVESVHGLIPFNKEAISLTREFLREE